MTSQLPPLAPPRECPAGCGRDVAEGQILCRECWAVVPRSLKTEVYATWDEWRSNLADPDARRRYDEARHRASLEAARVTRVAGGESA